ncbi:MAG: hypothetical protein ACI83W_000453 [Marinoscillum sp.]|jgi:hypothetical protein
MGNREIKISRGLNKLLKSKRNNHFQSQDIFSGDSATRNNYLDAFSQAQLAEIAYSAQAV